MQRRPKKEIPPDRIIVNEARKAAIAALPPEMQAERTARKHAAEARFRAKKVARDKRQRDVLERYLDAHSQVEIARALGCDPTTICKVLEPIWPLPKPGQNHAYIAIAISYDELAVVDELSRDMRLPRRRAIEEVLSAALEQNALPARRLLKVQGGGA